MASLIVPVTAQKRPRATVKSGSSASSDPEIYERRRLKAIAARWDARAVRWDADLSDPACHLNEDQAYPRFLSQLTRFLATRSSFCATHGLIDVGCGTGIVLEHTLSRFAWGVGIDISPRMIKEAESKQLANTSFIIGDCFNVPELCPRAGVVVSRGVLLSHYGLKQAEAFLRAMLSALVKGGWLVCDFLNEAARGHHLHIPHNKTWFTRAEIRALARRVGFRSARILGRDQRRVLILCAHNA